MATKTNPLLSIGSNSYCLQPQPAAILPKQHATKLSTFDQKYIPITVIEWDKPTFSKNDLASVCVDYEENDDVFCRDFLSRKCSKRIQRASSSLKVWPAKSSCRQSLFSCNHPR